MGQFAGQVISVCLDPLLRLLLQFGLHVHRIVDIGAGDQILTVDENLVADGALGDEFFGGGDTLDGDLVHGFSLLGGCCDTRSNALFAAKAKLELIRNLHDPD